MKHFVLYCQDLRGVWGGIYGGFQVKSTRGFRVHLLGISGDINGRFQGISTGGFRGYQRGVSGDIYWGFQVIFTRGLRGDLRGLSALNPSIPYCRDVREKELFAPPLPMPRYTYEKKIRQTGLGGGKVNNLWRASWALRASLISFRQPRSRDCKNVHASLSAQWGINWGLKVLNLGGC